MPRNRAFNFQEQLLLPWSNKRTVSAGDVARMLDVSINTVCRMIDDGTLKAYKVRPNKPNSPWRVNYESVIAYLERVHEANDLEKRF